MKIYKIKEIHYGLIILIITFIGLYLSGIEANMTLTHSLIIIISGVLLLIMLLNLLIILKIPHVGRLKLICRTDDYFINIYKQLFFYIYFVICTTIVGLLAEAMGNDRGQNILLISMLVSSIFYLIVAIHYTYNFVYQSSIMENIDYKIE